MPPPTTTSSRHDRLGSAGVALAFVVVMLGATLPTPLYPLYERSLGFGSFTVTLVFAAYAAGVVASLLGLGRASDVLGRRRMLLVAVGLAALSSVVFAATPPLGWLYVARVVSGLAAGIVTTTATVHLVELAPEAGRARAALLATVVNMLGLGLGPPLAGVLSEALARPLVTPYVVHLALSAVAALGLLAAREVVAAPGGRLRPTRPAVAREARVVFVPAAIAAFAAFAATGLVTSVTSGILAEVLGRTDRALVGVVVFSLFAASAVAQVVLRDVSTRVALRGGCLVLAVGVGLLGLSLPLASLPVLVAALAVIGVGQALCFRAGVAEITARTPQAERTATVTSFFLVAYVGISFPVVLVGLASRSWGLERAAEVFTVLVALLALVALVLQVVLARMTRAGQAEPGAGARSS